MAVDAIRNCARRTRMHRWRGNGRRRTFRPSRAARAGQIMACDVAGNIDPDTTAGGNTASIVEAIKERRPVAESAVAAAPLRALRDSSEASVQAMGEAHGECHDIKEACARAEMRKQRRVHFSEAQDTVIQVTPYCEVYGIHPRLFVFDRNYYMVPAGGQYGFVDLLAAAEVDKSLDVEDEATCESDGDDSDDGEWEPPVYLHFC
mmetsp:Transcript_71218/g.186728  ORF Transcript_71218/g.186728 Transcript_71218/m.186728 type:complete len:205 (+) Transcript_71218:83-697(+)